MKKILLLVLVFLMTSSVTIAQLRVENDSYVYVKDTYLYVKEGIHLENTGNIFLRYESQLLQGTTGNSTNSGTGKISLIQEGNATAYTYNYWSSPIGTPTGEVGNVPFFPLSTGTINDSIGLVTSNPAIFVGGSVSGYNGSSSPLKISRTWLYKYKPGSVYPDWVYIGQGNGSGFTNPGYGFSMKGTNIDGHQQPYDFRGRANDGTIYLQIRDGQETLIGNPYPSAVDLAAFFLDPDNAGKTAGGAMFWEQDLTVASHNVADYKGGYGIWIPDCENTDLSDCGQGLYTPATYDSYDNYGNLMGTGAASLNNFSGRRFCPIGQGFMIEGATSEEVDSLAFKNIHRVYYKEDNASYSVFNRNMMNSTETGNVENTNNNTPQVVYNNGGSNYNATTSTYERPRYIFQVIVNNTYTREISLVLNDNATLGFDYGYDGVSTSGLNNDVAFNIDNQDYLIQSTSFNVNDLVPLHFKSNGNNASFKILIGAYVNIDPSQEVYVYDSLLDEYHLIDASTDYTFTTTESNIWDRYSIAFTSTPLSNDTILDQGSILVHQDNNTHQLFIKNPDMYNFKQVNLYNINGQAIFTETNLDLQDNYTFNTSNLQTGVYLVNIVTDKSQVITKKITISK